MSQEAKNRIRVGTPVVMLLGILIVLALNPVATTRALTADDVYANWCPHWTDHCLCADGFFDF